MDRKSQLSNVSFGGAWSEQITGMETLTAAMDTIDAACERCKDEDRRRDDALAAAVRLVTEAHPKGLMLAAAWQRALCLENPGLRSKELQRIARVLRDGLGERLLT